MRIDDLAKSGAAQEEAQELRNGFLRPSSPCNLPQTASPIEKTARFQPVGQAAKLCPLSESVQVFRWRKSALRKRQSMEFCCFQHRCFVLLPDALDERWRAHPFDTQRLKHRLREILGVVGDDDVRLVVNGQSEDVTIVRVGQPQRVDDRLVSLTAGIREMLAHVRIKSLPCRVRHHLVRLKVPSYLFNDEVRPKWLKRFHGGQVKKEVPELKRVQDIGVQNGQHVTQ